ncbi:hypothetical protein ACFSQQ_16435 [Mesorhizobium kowhaii]|uniref:hypothetical protein n=1 Tax=Mesorhizobium kowhaii TaxID=1300272 RepID=UPI0035EAEB18
MGQQIINLGTTANDGTGTKARAGGDMINDNFTELYSQFGITPPNPQTGTTYTLQLSDMGKLLTFDNASSITVTLPQNSDVAFPAGFTFAVVGIGVGAVTITADGAATINGDVGVTLDGRWVGATFIQTDTMDSWAAFGRFA